MPRSDIHTVMFPESAPVSHAEEPLILVDESDRILGYGAKRSVHEGRGRLHRAFSVFLFDHRERLLLHRRGSLKPLWPNYWTNSCCSHPRRGESLDIAVRRRLREELGVSQATLRRLYSFEYHARFGDVGSEHELCHVFLARLPRGASIRAHRDEIAEWGWYSMGEVDALFAAGKTPLTPWCRQEWQALRGVKQRELRDFLRQPAAPESALQTTVPPSLLV